MICNKYQMIAEKTDGTKVVQAEIWSTNTPSTLPADGSTVDGLDATYTFAAGSYIYVVNGGILYLADENGTFVLQ